MAAVISGEFCMLAMITGKFHMLAVISGKIRMLVVISNEIRKLAVITGKFGMLAVINSKIHMLEFIIGKFMLPMLSIRMHSDSCYACVLGDLLLIWPMVSLRTLSDNVFWNICENKDKISR